MSKNTILIGDRRLMKQLRQIHDNAPKETSKALRAWATDTRDIAREEVPVDEGILRRSLASRVRKLNADIGYWGKKLREAFYVHWVHDGTSRIKGNPFLSRAFKKNRDARPYLRDLVERLIK